MAARPILRFPDRRLATPVPPVGEIGTDILRIWDDMIDTMDAMPGVGLAAPQIGVALALCVVDASDARGQAIRMANPDLEPLTDHGTAKGPEASPCLPGVQASVTRHARVLARYTDAAGQRVERELEGLWAVSAQHQLDHLNGMLFIDRLSRTKRDMLLRKYRKLQETG